uniref:Alpha N-terminal protein methyltransferase 1 n=1 Tax=Timema cristinae TaxID=61476 RepID=A0A7R9DA13_TIMCR|nr:unnamed protein product [Timema cristinae]
MEVEGNNTTISKDQADDISYDLAAKYWSGIPATVDGMLGGFGFISHTDIQGSLKFLRQLFKMRDPPGRRQALDCGAGIGRVSKNLLIQNFEKVDLVEQNPVFLEHAKNYIGPCDKVGEFYNFGLQDFIPDTAKYDVIWSQWVLGHLTDEHFIQFFKRCMQVHPFILCLIINSLKPSGVIVVKENLSSKDVEIDPVDSSVTRPHALLRHLFQQAGLNCFKEVKQSSLPSGLYEVRMFALRPGRWTSPGESQLIGETITSKS